jgi:hypothetical protein
MEASDRPVTARTPAEKRLPLLGEAEGLRAKNCEEKKTKAKKDGTGGDAAHFGLHRQPISTWGEVNAAGCLSNAFTAVLVPAITAHSAAIAIFALR